MIWEDLEDDGSSKDPETDLVGDNHLHGDSIQEHMVPSGTSTVNKVNCEPDTLRATLRTSMARSPAHVTHPPLTIYIEMEKRQSQNPESEFVRSPKPLI